MGIAYQYKLKPNKQQIEIIEYWFHLLRLQYNYRMAERFDWYEQNRCNINSCPLILLWAIRFAQIRESQRAPWLDIFPDRHLYLEFHNLIDAINRF